MDELVTKERPVGASQAGMALVDVDNAMHALSQGGVVVLTDGEHGESRLIGAAVKATTESVAFMIRHGSGFLVAAARDDRADRLDLPELSATCVDFAPRVAGDPRAGHSQFTDRFCVAVDAIEDCGTGISAVDRARTLRRLAAPDSRADQFSRPGHVVTERVSTDLDHVADPAVTTPALAAVELCRLAGLDDVAAYCALESPVSPVRTALASEASDFASAHDLELVDVDTIRRYTLHRSRVRRTFEHDVDSVVGRIHSAGWTSTATGDNYTCYTRGDLTSGPVLVAVHSVAPDFHTRSDARLDTVLRFIGAHGSGLTIVRDAMDELTEARGRDIAALVAAHGIEEAVVLEAIPMVISALSDLGLRCSTSLPRSLTASEQIVIRGFVTRGDQRGRELGFPTANLELPDVGQAVSRSIAAAISGRIPDSDGVWAGECRLPDGRRFGAAISIGRRPTFYGKTGVRLLEAHLLDFDDDIYGLPITVVLVDRLRPQTGFDSKEALIDALNADVDSTRQLMAERLVDDDTTPVLDPSRLALPG